MKKNSRVRNEMVSVANIRALERDKDDEQKARRRSQSYVEDFLRNRTQSQPKDRMCSRKSISLRTLIAPSILSADFTRLSEEIKAVEKAGADAIHIDVMDGHFVPNITIGPPVVAKIRGVTKLPLDCHLMIENPGKYINAFAKAGADWISVHVEACDLADVLPKIRDLGLKAGCAINPPTSVKDILPYVPLSDFVLVMTVNPGFGGQKMIESCVEKIAAIKTFLDERGLEIPIEADGGLNAETISKVTGAGASIIVAGKAIFEEKDYAEEIRKMIENCKI